MRRPRRSQRWAEANYRQARRVHQSHRPNRRRAQHSADRDHQGESRPRRFAPPWPQVRCRRVPAAGTTPTTLRPRRHSTTPAAPVRDQRSNPGSQRSRGRRTVRLYPRAGAAQETGRHRYRARAFRHRSVTAPVVRRSIARLQFRKRTRVRPAASTLLPQAAPGFRPPPVPVSARAHRRRTVRPGARTRESIAK